MYNYVKKILTVILLYGSMAVASAPVMRLDCERLDNGKLLVRNYGYDSTHILLSWGCAAEVVNIVTEQDCASKADKKFRAFLESRLAHSGNCLMPSIEASVSSSASGSRFTKSSAPASIVCRPLDSEIIAVVGGGISGMTVAHLLSKFGYRVNMYLAKIFRPNDTPNLMKQILLPEDTALPLPDAEIFGRINNFAKKCMSELLAKKSQFEGVFEAQSAYFKAASDDSLPMSGFSTVEFTDKPLVVDLFIYMQDLYTKMLRVGVMPLVEDRFARRESVFDLTEDIIIDCTGVTD
jgi:hypothetical protein